MNKSRKIKLFENMFVSLLFYLKQAPRVNCLRLRGLAWNQFNIFRFCEQTQEMFKSMNNK